MLFVAGSGLDRRPGSHPIEPLSVAPHRVIASGGFCHPEKKYDGREVRCINRKFDTDLRTGVASCG